jgi:hypothetical protein
VDRATREFLKELAMKGVIVGFSKRRIYVESEDKAKAALAAINAFGLGDVYKEKDIAVIGKVQALSGQGNFRAQKWRPLMMGISVGHREITAGTLGGFASKSSERYIISNAHVLHPWPFMTQPPYNKRVWQPGPHDAKYDYEHEGDYYVADYAYHVRIHSIYEYPECPISRTINTMYRALGRNSRVRALQVPNYVDLAIARIMEGVGIVNNTYAYVVEKNADFDASRLVFVGNLFAGTSLGHAVICKTAKYWSKYFTGYDLMFQNMQAEVEPGQKLKKDGRTSGATIGTVWDDSASLAVGYWLDVAWFEDVVLTYEDMGAKGGDSGSPVFLAERARAT